MKTAVEWLEEQFKLNLNFPLAPKYQGIIDTAKEIEKEQIIEAYWDGYTKPYSQAMITEAEQYYNETFKNK